MKLLALSLLFALSSFAQTAVFPQAVATDAQLGIATNNIQTLLSGSITSTATSFGVVSATGMAANQIATIDSENVWICGVSGLTVSVGRSACPNVDGRGFDGSAAVSHSANGANCNFGTASGCVSEFVVGWHHNAPAKEIEAVEAYLHTRPIFEAVRDYGADPTGATDSTSALQAGLNAAKAAGACLHVQGSTTRQSFGATYAVPSPYFTISAPLTMTGNACLMMDATTTILQTAVADGLDITGSNNYVSGGVIAYNVNATSSIGISVSDTPGVGSEFNNIVGTKVYGNLATGALGKCFSVTSNYGGGSYSNNVLEIYGQFCGTGVYENGLGIAGPSSNAFVNIGNVTGSIDNSNQAAYFNNAGEKFVSLEMNGDQAGILIDSTGGGVTAGIHILDNRGGEGGTYRVKFNNANARDNTYESAGVVLPGGIVDLSGGLNNIPGPDAMFTGQDLNGSLETCLGCYTNQYFPLITPVARFTIVDVQNPYQRNLFDIANHVLTPQNPNSWFLLNPYGSSKNSPFGGLFSITATTFPAGAPVAFFENGNGTNNANNNPGTSIGLGWGQYSNVWLGGLRSHYMNTSVSATTMTELQAQGGSNAIYTTTGTAASGSNQLTVATNPGLANGQLVFAPGIPEGTTVSSFSGLVVTLSANTTAALVSSPPVTVTFSTITSVFGARGDGAFGGMIILSVANLPSCNSTLPPLGSLLLDALVNDLTTPALGSAPTGGGAVRGRVTCGYNGASSAWHVSAF